VVPPRRRAHQAAALKPSSITADGSDAQELRFSATDFNSYVTVSTAEGAPRRLRGRMAASAAPGLGVEPRVEVLGEPVVEVG
jgi:hypothetical protein